MADLQTAGDNQPGALNLDASLERELRALRDELVPTLRAAVALIGEVNTLRALTPGDANPVVILRQKLAGVFVAADELVASAGTLLHGGGTAAGDAPRDQVTPTPQHP